MRAVCDFVPIRNAILNDFWVMKDLTLSGNLFCRYEGLEPPSATHCVLIGGTILRRLKPPQDDIFT